MHFVWFSISLRIPPESLVHNVRFNHENYVGWIYLAPVINMSIVADIVIVSPV